MLNQRIKELRLAYGISQVQLAAQLGVSKQCVSNWENDNIQPSIDMLVKIASFFSVTTDYLLGLIDKQFLEISGLSSQQITHLNFIINDIKAAAGNVKTAGGTK
ncbi:MAG: helix-turn-helix domain-containing protein [Clostridiales bacterium]|jgi:transcriptional regulator with XRE-family HTH domain|nr:helix-turn-helix domain-containing protein [Clostridiales bacterium]